MALLRPLLLDNVPRYVVTSTFVDSDMCLHSDMCLLADNLLKHPALLRCSIQQSAALALGRLANYSDDLAEAVVQNEILPQLVYSLSEQNRFYKQAAAFCLRAVAKHSPELAQAVIDSGSLDSLVTC